MDSGEDNDSSYNASRQAMLYESDPQNRMRSGSLCKVHKEALEGRRMQGLGKLKMRLVLRKQLILCKSMSLCQIRRLQEQDTNETMYLSRTHKGCRTKQIDLQKD